MSVDLGRTCLPALAVALSLTGVMSPGGATAIAADPLAAAKALYISAEYEKALDVLSKLDAGAAADEADQYRALCLLALGRTAEVEHVVETLIERNPTFTMARDEVPPRLVAVFDETRRRMLPGVLERRFAAAKASFERRDYAEASSRFRALLALLADEGVAGDEPTAVAADLRAIAEGYLEVAETRLSALVAADPRPGIVGPGSTAPGVTGAAGSRAIDAGAASATSSTPLSVRDEPAIREVVLRYARAYSARDVGAVAAIFPDVSPRPLQTAFGGLISQTVDARDMQITIDPAGHSAEVTLTWVVDAVPRVGGPMRTQVPVTLRLRKAPTGGWLIIERR